MPQVYERFFQLRPDAEGLMQQADVSMRGRMLDQTFELLMDPDVLGPESYFRWEVTNHVSAYGVSADMYGPYFQAVGDACICLGGLMDPANRLSLASSSSGSTAGFGASISLSATKLLLRHYAWFRRLGGVLVNITLTHSVAVYSHP